MKIRVTKQFSSSKIVVPKKILDLLADDPVEMSRMEKSLESYKGDPEATQQELDDPDSWINYLIDQYGLKAITFHNHYGVYPHGYISVKVGKRELTRYKLHKMLSFKNTGLVFVTYEDTVLIYPGVPALVLSDPGVKNDLSPVDYMIMALFQLKTSGFSDAEKVDILNTLTTDPKSINK